MTPTAEIRSDARAPVAVVLADDGWQWVLKATCVVAVAVGGLQVLALCDLVWGVAFAGVRVSAGPLFDVKNLLLVGWLVVNLAGVACLFLAGVAGLRRWPRARGLMLITALVRAVGTLSMAVYSYVQMREYFAVKGWQENLFHHIQQALHVVSELWLPALLFAVATRPAIKLMLDDPRAGAAFEPLPAPV